MNEPGGTLLFRTPQPKSDILLAIEARNARAVRPPRPYLPPKVHKITIDLATGERTVERDVTAVAEKRNSFLRWRRPMIVEIIRPHVAGVPSVRHILAAVAGAYGISEADLLSPKRHSRFARARFALFMFLKKHRNMSLIPIGRIVGRDHTTILSGLRRGASLYESDVEWRARFDSVEARIQCP